MIASTQNRVSTGKLLAIAFMLVALTVSLMLAARPAYATTTFTVNSIGDKNDVDFPGGVFDGSSDGKCFTGDILVVQGEECTLRAAIQEANATTGADIVEFDIPTTGVASITPASELPKITGPLTINGYSQPGAEPNTKAIGSDAKLKIELSGVDSIGSGLQVEAANSTVKGLVINRWNYGLRLDGPGATGNKVTGNYIGTDASGAQDLGNASHGVSVDGANNIVGGTTAVERNVISGNDRSGILFEDTSAGGNKVTGNYIGTDASGLQDLGNTLNGIGIDDVPNNTIGGTTTGTRNVISGNNGNGISIFGNGGNKITGNYVGTDASGTKGLGNTDHGVYVGGPNNTVGGTTAAERNVVSGNGFGGITIAGADATGNRVVGNLLGTDASGTKDLGNYYGVFVYDAPNNTIGGTTAAERNVASGNVYGISIGGAIGENTATGNRVVGNYVGTDASGASGPGNSIHGVLVYDTPNNTIGGTTAGSRNVISGNGQKGVVVTGSGATGNRILSNSIYSHASLGIDLGDNGPTANDPGDTDTGPNNLQNKPVLSLAKKGATGTTTVRGTLNSTPGRTFQLQFFSNPEGTDEGKTLLGSESLKTDGTGNFSFAFSTKKAIRLGQNITATATSPDGNTSEFSAPRKVVAQ